MGNILNKKARDPAFWEHVRTAGAYSPLIEDLMRLWNADCSGEIPAGKFSEFILFHTTGSRREYEFSYFRRRRALNASALLSLIYPENGEYFTRLCDLIWAILDEYSWVLPAHIGDFSRCVTDCIDLFAAETVFSLTEIDYLLGERLPPLLRSRIRAEVDARVVDVYLHGPRSHWETVTHNWAAVCAAGVCAAILYLHPELFGKIRERIESTIRCFLSGYPEDGMCLEGFGYWHYGFGFFCALAEMLRNFTDGEIDWFQDPKVRAISRCGQRMYLDGSCTVSFSDSGMRGRYHIGLLHFLKGEYPGEISVPPREISYSWERTGRWCPHFRAFLWLDESLEGAGQPEYAEEWMPCSQWLVKKSPLYSFAAKGGHNGEPHNHNDIGSFIVTYHGEQLLCDPGAAEYTKDYFNEHRYEYFKAGSQGHSVPIIGGRYQKGGAEYASSRCCWENGVFSVEFAGAYDLPTLQELTRIIQLSEDGFLLEDTFSFAGESETITERFIAAQQPQVRGERIMVGNLSLCVETDAVQTVQITEHTEKETVWCVDFLLKPGTDSFTLSGKVGSDTTF